MLSPETQKRLINMGCTETELIEVLRKVFPNGHEDYLPQCIAEMELHSLKNHDYASGGDSLGNFKRVAAILGHYKGLDLSDPRVVAFVYAMKQIDAVLWSLSQNITAKVEGIVPRLDDVAVYAKIIKCLTIEAARNVEIDRQFGVDLQQKKVQQEATHYRDVSAKAYTHEPMPEGKPYPPAAQAQCGQYRPGSVLISHDKVRTVKSTDREGVETIGPACPELNQTRDREETPIERAARGGPTRSPYDCGPGNTPRRRI